MSCPKKPKVSGFWAMSGLGAGAGIRPAASPPPPSQKDLFKTLKLWVFWNSSMFFLLDSYLVLLGPFEPSSVFNTFLAFCCYLQWICNIPYVFAAIYNEYATFSLFLLLFTMNMQNSLCFCCYLQWIRNILYVFAAIYNEYAMYVAYSL